jgi:hypothetical protein
MRRLRAAFDCCARIGRRFSSGCGDLLICINEGDATLCFLFVVARAQSAADEARNTIMFVTIARLYEDPAEAADAIDQLKKAGVPQGDISIFTGDDRVRRAATGAEIGATVGGLAGLLSGLGLVAIPGIGPVVATGWLAATAAGAAAGGLAGGAFGVLSQVGVTSEEAQEMSDCLRRGHTLVAARVANADKGRHQAILDHAAIDVQIRAGRDRQSGWRLHDFGDMALMPE